MTRISPALLSARTICLFLALGVCHLHSARAQNETVVINEIMYHPVEKDAFNADGTPALDLSQDIHEYIELYNYGTSTVSIAGWKLTGGIGYTFPAGAQIGPFGFVVVAKNKSLLAAVPQYGLVESNLFGPYSDSLGNKGEAIRLKNDHGQIVDGVTYSSSFPWAIGADALGAGDHWTGLNGMDYQYRGRSLERVSATWPSNDPANWLASPIPGEPSPGRANSVTRSAPLPVVAALRVSQNRDGQNIIRSGEPVRIDIAFSATNDLGNVRIEYFADDINSTNEATAFLPMSSTGDAMNRKYSVVLPGQTDRTIIRYRIRAQRGGQDQAVSPRPDDPFRWHAYFVSPVRTSANPIYDIFISNASLHTMDTNINQNPRRVTFPDPPGNPRESWNATEPAVFVYNGVVRDIQIRYHGSRYNRSMGRQSYKIYFPKYDRLKEYDSIFETDKGLDTADAHGLFRAVGLPSSRTQPVDFYVNNNPGLVRLEQENYDQVMLDEYRQDQKNLNPSQPQLDIGDLYKCEGLIQALDPNGEGPYGLGDGRLQPGKAPYWTPLDMYKWTYTIEDNTWKGHTGFKSMIDGMWAARGDSITSRHPNIPALRDYFLKNFDVDKLLTYIASVNWMGPFDDTTQNHYLWQEADGKWSMLGWDFDYFFTDSGESLFAGEDGDRSNNFRGPNYFKDSIIKAFREELKQRFFLLNNTILSPASITALGYGYFRGFADSRFVSVNQQCGYGPFQRPNKPVLSPLQNSSAILPPVSFSSSSYSHSATPASPHASTTWEIRAGGNTYDNLAFKATTSTNLTNFRIPFESLSYGQTYFARVTYTDADGHPSAPSDEISFTFGSAAPGPARAVSLNEIMAGDTASGSQWIELYNSAGAAQNIGGYGLSNDPTNPGKFVFPAGTAMPPHSYLFVSCDTATNSGSLHSGFSLDPLGQIILFSSPNGAGFTLADSVVIGLQAANFSVGRVPDGTGPWRLGAPTAAAPNSAQPLGAQNGLKINEWLASPSSGSGWFELYNSAALPISLENLSVSNDTQNPTNTVVPSLSFVAPGGFVRFWADGNQSVEANHANFQLNSSFDSISLYSTNGQTIDAVEFGPQKAGFSEGRIPDGSNNISRLDIPTPAAVNVGGLRFQSINVLGNICTLQFRVMAGRTYTVQCSDAFPAAVWIELQTIPAPLNDLIATVTDSFLPARQFRFYRLLSSP